MTVRSQCRVLASVPWHVCRPDPASTQALEFSGAVCLLAFGAWCKLMAEIAFLMDGFFEGVDRCGFWMQGS